MKQFTNHIVKASPLLEHINISTIYETAHTSCQTNPIQIHIFVKTLSFKSESLIYENTDTRHIVPEIHEKT